MADFKPEALTLTSGLAVLRIAAALAVVAAAPTCAAGGDAPVYTCEAAPSSCWIAHGTGGCNDYGCCIYVCQFIDSSCCQTEWDELCVEAASQTCPPPFGSCCEIHNGVACDDPACAQVMCGLDPFCCEVQWDSSCRDGALLFCDGYDDVCGSPCGGDCGSESPDKPGCGDSECCFAVCAQDELCCIVAWDATCAAIAQAICGCEGCGDPTNGSCFSEHGEPFCDSAACCETVCDLVPPCCDPAGTWDYACVEAAVIHCCQPAAETLYVDLAATGANDGSSWADAFTRLDDALDVARINLRIHQDWAWFGPSCPRTTQILVAEGTYVPGCGSPIEAFFEIPAGVELLGGFPAGGGDASSRNPCLYPTVLSGDLAGDDLPDFGNDDENSLWVVRWEGAEFDFVVDPPEVLSSRLDGFAITGGHGRDYQPDCGMISCLMGCATGAGLFASGTGLEVRNCRFEFNRTECGYGGAVAAWADSRPGVSPLSFENCVFLGNECSQPSPGSSVRGGAIFISVFGGADPVVTIRGCTLAGNRCLPEVSGSGGGLAIDGFRAGAVILSDSILWGNSATEIDDIGGSLVARYSLVQDGWPGVGMIDGDPLFVDVESGDVHLSTGPASPCIDAGDPEFVAGPELVDLDCEARVVGGRVDMGADEADACVDCDGNGLCDGDEIAMDPGLDCDGNGILDGCQIPASSPGGRCPTPTHPDLPCDPDCNVNGIVDACEADCNGNGVPDDCDIAGGFSQDCDGNGVPDECDPDCNDSGHPDPCDVLWGLSPDCNGNLLPDECDLSCPGLVFTVVGDDGTFTCYPTPVGDAIKAIGVAEVGVDASCEEVRGFGEFLLDCGGHTCLFDAIMSVRLTFRVANDGGLPDEFNPGGLPATQFVIRVEPYAADGVAAVSDYSAAATAVTAFVGAIEMCPPQCPDVTVLEPGHRVGFDVTAAYVAAKRCGATHVGFKLRPASDPLFGAWTFDDFRLEFNLSTFACAPDFNVDGIVDGSVSGGDLGQLLGSWGPCPPCATACQWDLTGDGVVDGADLGQLLAGWGPCWAASTADCCSPHEEPGCSNAACRTAVCELDPWCCLVEWDQTCADEADAKCATCP